MKFVMLCLSLSLILRSIFAKNYTLDAIFEITLEQLRDLRTEYRNSTFGENQIDVLWQRRSNQSSLVAVKVNSKLAKRLKRQVNHKLLTDNLQNWIDQTKYSPLQDQKPYYSDLVPNFRFDIYHTLQEVNRFLVYVSKIENVKLFDIGGTQEGKAIKAIEILNNPADHRYVWIDATTHAREWVSLSAALFIIEQAIISRIPVNFIIVPVVNPDGYEYTWTTDRLWRKNRRPPPLQEYLTRDECFGIDINRNYDANFGGDGSSDDPCSAVFHGKAPFSEPETAAITRLIWKMRNQIKFYVTLHSFEQLWSCPFAYTTESSNHLAEHFEVLTAIREAIMKTTGQVYKIGPLSTELYVGSGYSLDWVYEKVGITHSYLAELRDNGTYGFLLPSDQIMPTCVETWAAINSAICKIFQMKC